MNIWYGKKYKKTIHWKNYNDSLKIEDVTCFNWPVQDSNIIIDSI